jgi:DNA-binding NarL/FixJ family response regulator
MTKQKRDDNNSKIYSISPSKLKEQRQIILNLYNSGIEPDVIAYQLDISQEEANKIIKDERKEEGIGNETENIRCFSFYG